MHELRGPDDRVDGTGLDALGAADAGLFVDDRDSRWHDLAVLGIEWRGFASQQFRESRYALVTAGRALVDAGFARGDRVGIRATALEAAARALRLRKERVDADRERVHWDSASIESVSAV